MAPGAGAAEVPSIGVAGETELPTVIRSLNLRASSPLAVADQIEEGLSYEKLEALQNALQLSGEQIAEAIGISPRTLSRRKDSGQLTTGESDRLVQLGMLFDEAVVLFDDDVAAARDWFKRSNRALGDKAPLTVASTFVGAREVEKLIGRLEYGVFA